MTLTEADMQREARTARWLLAAILLCLALQAWLALVMEANWDEFFFLSHIYNYQRGEMTKALQSFYVHLLGWLTAIPGDELDQVRAGRLVMLACFAGSCGLIYLLSRCFLPRLAALVAVLVFASAGFSIIHGASFRADPIAAVLAMASLVVLARGRLNLVSLAGAALLAAIAAMITVKAGLYAPAFLGIAGWRILTAPDRRAAMLWFAGAGLATAAAFALLYLVQLQLLPKATTAATRAGLGSAAETQFSGALLPRLGEIMRFVATAPVQAILLLAGLGTSAAMLGPRQSRPRAIALAGCGSTMLWLLVYRNAFPYFFPFILAPAAVLAGLAFDRIEALKRHVLLVTLALTLPAVLVAWTWSKRDQAAQQQLIGAVHAMFPRPVPYIDRNSMIASFPKRGFFMSTWGLQSYRRAGKPVIAGLLERDTIPFVIANGPALENAFGALSGLAAELSLLDEDKAVLRDNFIPHWGPIHVAGKALRATPEGAGFIVHIPGDYTVEGMDAAIDGKGYRVGQLVPLGRGRHIVRSTREGSVILRWGENPPRPPRPFVGPVYRGF